MELRRSRVMAAAMCGGASAALFWIPTVRVPFFQDDFKFLERAARSTGSGHSIVDEVFVQAMPHFWRPISVNLYWRFVHDIFFQSSVAAHFLNLLLILLVAAAAGMLASAVIRYHSVAGLPPERAAFVAAGVYGIHGAFFLPAAWASAVQESLALLFGIFFLRAGLEAWFAESRKTSLWALAVLPLLLLAALLCKEGAVVLPLLLAILIVGRAQKAPSGRFLIFAAAVSLVVVLLGWAIIRSSLTDPVPPGSPYAYVAGLNILRNAGALALFMINVPREAFLPYSGTSRIIAPLWGGLCALLQLGALLILLREARQCGAIPWRRFLLFSAVALSPYLPLKWNCYPYYSLLALLPLAFIAAQATRGEPPRIIVAGLLALSSSVLLQAGQWIADYPAPIARARWGEQQRRRLESVPAIRATASRGAAVYVIVEDQNRFSAAGSSAGIAKALGVTSERIRVVTESSHRSSDTLALRFTPEGMTIIPPHVSDWKPHALLSN